MNVEGVNWPKIVTLVLLTLVAMRLVSWLVGWALRRAVGLRPTIVAIASNGIVFAGFVLLLWLDLETGEPLDWDGVLFAGLVFGCYMVFDLLWFRRAARLRDANAGQPKVPAA